ncbi:ankyrin repeat domain-containing protein [Beggiatoa alba]|nr:ankyrin repeat domain-containing protein [Beggiatoa alba]
MYSVKKKIVLSISALLIMALMALLVAGGREWKQHVDSLDVPTAYSYYLMFGWDVHFNYLKNIDNDDIPALEEGLHGLIIYINQAYESEGYGTITKDQEEENARIIKLALLFLEKGADINYTHPTKSYNTPLNSAISKASPSLVQFLLDHGADPAVRGRIGEHERTALEHARQYISRRMTSQPLTQEKLREIIAILESQ